MEHQAWQTWQEMFHLVEADRHREAALDFSTVDFLSSMLWGKLITLDKKIKAHGGVC